jgi:hypothetical protein
MESIFMGGLSPLFLFNIYNIEYPPASPERLAMAGRSNKEFRTAEVFESSRAIFFTSIFCGSLFCGSAVHILDAEIRMANSTNGTKIEAVL